MSNFKKQLLGQHCGSNVEEWHVVGSVDGLFMLTPHPKYIHNEVWSTSHIQELMLWNPSIRKARILPHPPQAQPCGIWSINVGLGFDSSIKDYKYVRFELIDQRNLNSVLVYTLGTNSWKTDTFRGKGCPNGLWFPPSKPKTVFFHGVLYLLAFTVSNNFYLVSYDLSYGEITSSNLPMSQDLNRYYYCCCWDLTLAKNESCLALFNFLSPIEGSIWLADGFGANITWSKCYTFAFGVANVGIRRFILYLDRDNEEMLIGWEATNMVISHNLKTHKEKVVLKGSAKLFMVGACPYVESLI